MPRPHPPEFRAEAIRLARSRESMLALIPPRQLAAATGRSPGYCTQIRDGKRTPHVRHWAALQLAGLTI